MGDGDFNGPDAQAREVGLIGVRVRRAFRANCPRGATDCATLLNRRDQGAQFTASMKPETALELIRAQIIGRGAISASEVKDSRLIIVDAPFPRLYANLVRTFGFRAFDVGSIRLYSNIPSEPENLNELNSDEALTKALVKAGYAPFGRPATGSYDRVCFDVRKRSRAFDAPIVVLDHEAVLSFNRIPAPRLVAEGLLPLLELYSV